MIRYIICFSAVTLLSCSNKKSTDPDEKETGSKDSTGQKDSENDSSSQDSTHSDGSTDDQDSDDRSSESSATDGQEVLYEFPALEESGGSMHNLDVDDEYLYYATDNALYRADKNGTGEPVVMGARPRGASYQVMAFSGDNVFWLLGSSVARWNKSTGEVSELSLDGKEQDIYIIAADSEKLYLSEIGFQRILTMFHDGENLEEIEMYEYTGYPCGTTIMMIDERYVYAGGSGCGPYMGKVVRWPKQGGKMTEVVSLPELDGSFTDAGPQVTGMALVQDNLYMISSFKIDAKMQYFGTAKLEEGVYERIAELKGTLLTKRLHYDSKTNALYFLAQGDADVCGIYKYSIQNKTLVRIFEEYPYAPMAADEDYLYWHSRYQIFRMKKQ